MDNLKIPAKFHLILKSFTRSLEDIYQGELVSLILYGSAASGEFVEKHSNLNLLVVLKNTHLESLKKSARILQKYKVFNTLFMAEDYIARSLDVFPIEFLDMRENHFVLYGKDILKDIHVDISNLRFQVELELKQKFLKLQHAFLKINNDANALKSLLFASFTSVLHILRNVLRLKGVTPPYLKQEILNQLALQFKINTAVWKKILAAKNKEIKLNPKETEELLADFINEVEAIIAVVDQL